MPLVESARAMMSEVKCLMESYHGLGEEWMDVERFLKLMIVDGCFFLDVMIWHIGFYFKPYMTAKFWMDMLLLENQLLLAALAVLIEMRGDKVQDTKEFIKYYPNSFRTRFESIREMGFHHLHIFLKNTTMEGSYFYERNLACALAALEEGMVARARRKGEKLLQKLGQYTVLHLREAAPAAAKGVVEALTDDLDGLMLAVIGTGALIVALTLMVEYGRKTK